MVQPFDIDLRSDTVTQPCPQMREAMMSAKLGDDVFGDDPSVLALQAHVATVLKKEAALFVPSGTMANQLALRAHTRHGDEVIAHAKSHIVNYESGGGAALAGVHFRVIESADGTLPIEALERSLHQTSDPHFANTRLLAFENTHNGCGGLILPADHVRAVCDWAESKGLGLHLDGARLFNASVGSGVSPAKLAAPFGTVSVCLSKGLGAPVGSVLAGRADLIATAYRFRKMYGGGMRQAGFLAAAGLYALKNNVERLADDHRRARLLAEAINDIDGLRVDLSAVHTNLVYLDIDPSHSLARLGEDGRPAIMSALEAEGVFIVGGVHRLRAALHFQVGDHGTELAAEAFAKVMG
ncbi:MAG: threonine aldolase [Myxococcota bacterium]|jgi:threonine aldolase